MDQETPQEGQEKVSRLRPGAFGNLSPAEAGRRGAAAAAATRARKADEKREEANAKVLRKQWIASIVDALPPGEDLETIAQAVCIDIGSKVLTGELAITSAQHAAHLAKAFHDIAEAEWAKRTGGTGAKDQPMTPAQALAKLSQIKGGAASG
ncbi:MAG: hypothetical protein AB7G37_06335 [Solirubrobacteraceae bacterium]